MSSFILPLTIESRKIVFLELSRDLDTGHEFPQNVEDNFVVRLPEPPVQDNDLIILHKNNVVQALERGMKDLPVKELSGCLIQASARGQFELFLSDNPKQGVHEMQVQPGRRLCVTNSDEYIKLSFTNGNNLQPEELKIRIRIDIHLPDSVRTYYGFIRFSVVPKANMLFLALDFGSEASQMREARYAPGHSLSLSPQVTNLFRLMRNQHQEHKELSDDVFEQFESLSLYKSVFYANRQQEGIASSNVLMGNKVYKLSGDIRMMVPNADVNLGNNSSFRQDYIKIPNLKLVRNSGFLANEAEFSLTAGGETFSQMLGQIRGSLYMALLKNMLDAYLIQLKDENNCLRLTLLVPNIYQPEDIMATKTIVCEIMTDYVAAGKLLDFEVDCLSESDASFLGSILKISVTQGNYYIVVDCGKGTTDYSIVEMQEGSGNVYRPLYRNGFAGAGNYITYAFIKSALHFLLHDCFEEEEKMDRVKNFIESRFSSEDVYFHNELFRIAELWKKSYSTMPFPNKGAIEKLWRDARSGDLTLDDCFDSVSTNKTRQNFLDVLKKIPGAWDWNGYISKAIGDIVGDVVEQLTPVIVHQNKHARCGGIIITGRGAYFKPLADAVTKAVQGIDGMQKVKRIDLGDANLKTVCMDGIFGNSVRSYADLMATPIEVDKKTLRQVRKKEHSIWKKIFGTGGGSGAAYDHERNAIEVVNTNNLLNTGILIGSTLYDFGGVHLSSSNSTLHLVPMRNGVILLEKGQDGKVIQQHLLGTGGLKKNDEQRTFDSLYPNWHRFSILESLQS